MSTIECATRPGNEPRRRGAAESGAVFPVAPAVLGFVAVHATLRRDAADLLAVAERTPGDHRQLEARIELLTRVLTIHHRGEEDLLLPALRDRQPGFEPQARTIEIQHHELDASLDLLRQGATASRVDVATTSESCKLLEHHLCTEEQHLLPVWLESFTRAEHDEFAARLRRSTSLRDMRVIIPWLLEATPVPYREMALREVPRPVRIVHHVWWRRRFQRRLAPSS